MTGTARTNEMGGTVVEGETTPPFAPVRDAFAAVLRGRPGFGAALAIHHHGRPVVDLWGGSYRRDTLQLVWSCTKGTIGVVAALLVQRGLLDLDAPVASIWPEFGAAGKERIPVRWVLSHQAGLPGVDRRISMADVVAGEPLLRALEAQVPLWEPGTAHGYHALTIGALFGEIVERITGRTFGRYFAEEVAGPLGLDFWVGLPEVEEARVAPTGMNALSATGVAAPEVLVARADPASIHNRVFSNPPLDPLEWNSRAVHAAEIPAGNGICTARSLSRMYAACITPVDGRRLLTDETVAIATREQANGIDRVNLEPTRFGLAFALPFPRLPFGGSGAFGHDGLSGGMGFADPALGLAFGFTTDLVPELTGADPVVWDLLAATRRCLEDAGSVG